MKRTTGGASRRRHLGRLLVGAFLATAVAACLAVAAWGAGLVAGERLAETATTAPPRHVSTTVTTAATPVAPPPTTGPPPTTRPPTTRPSADTLRAGDTGTEVAELQARLVELGYWLGTPDGTYGDLTTQAVVAFQKAEGLGRDGIAGPATRDRLGRAARPAARLSNGIEIDLARQLLLVVGDGRVDWVLNTSTGASATPTPTGRFEITRAIDGVRRARLGDLYRPRYFNGGIAVHGFPAVPAHPASHGCARVSMAAMDFLWSEDAAPVGTAVWVYA